MSRRRGTIPRFGVILLLLLVVSPVTAPFSTCDLLDLLGGPASAAGAVFQSKPTGDQPAPGTGGSLVLHVSPIATSLTIVRSLARSRSRTAFHLPLRI